MAKKEEKLKDEDKEYYISTKDEDGDFLIYQSEAYRISEIDLINLIKITLIEARSNTIGRKLLEVYRDSTHERKEVTEKRLDLIGVKNGKEKPIKTEISHTR